MFSQRITDDKYPFLDYEFGNLDKINYADTGARGYDRSILATLKLLLAPRLPSNENDEEFWYYVRKVTTLDFDGALNALRLMPVYDEGSLFAVLYRMGYYKGNSWMYPTLSVIYLDSKLYDAIGFTKSEDDPLNKFFKQRDLNITVRYKDDGRNTFVFISHNNISSYIGKAWHAVASLIPTILPTYFKDKPLDKEELSMLLALDTSADNYYDAVKALTKARGYDAQWVSNALKNFSGIKYNRKISRRESDLRELLTRRSDRLNSLASLNKQIDDIQIELVGLREKHDDGDADASLIEYVKNNKCINLIAVADGVMQVEIRTYLTNYDPDMYSRVSGNYNSSLYARMPRDIDPKDYHMLLDEIFSKEVLKLKVMSKIKLGINGEDNLICSGRNAVDRYEEHSCLPNTHIQLWNCFGNNEVTIHKCIQECDFVGALAQTIGSVSNLNFADGAVTPEFTYDLLSSEYHIECIEFPDGECLTARDAIERLKNEQTDKAD